MSPYQDRWMTAWEAVGARGDPVPWYEQLVAAYSEPHRHYHNLRHIADCLGEFEPIRHSACRPEAVELALWFHDAVYDPRAGDNEEQSAALVRRCLLETGVALPLCETVYRLVLATKHHDATLDSDAALMVDVDLSILGQPDERFGEYESQIRSEYAWVPAATFAMKRAEILERFLARPQLFTTDWFRKKYEQQARRNIQLSLDRLRQQTL